MSSDPAAGDLDVRTIRQFVNLCRIPMAVLNLQSGSFDCCNHRFAGILGYSPEELGGVNPRSLLRGAAGEDQPFDSAVRSLLDTGMVYMECDLCHKDGQVLSCEWHGSLLVEAPVPLATVMVCEAAVRRLAEREQRRQWYRDEKMRSIATLAGGVAHDFNNILVSVLGNASLIQSEMSPQHRWYPAITAVVESAERAAAVTQQLLAYARSGDFTPQRTSLEGVIADALSLCRSALPAGVEVVFDGQRAEADVVVDPTQLQQMLINLSLNAAEAMPDGGKIIILTERGSGPADSELADKPCACLHFRDEGGGIGADIRDKIFEPFFTTKQFGRGLGLASVYGMLENHGAQIRLISEPGAGTHFAIYFPLYQEE